MYTSFVLDYYFKTTPVYYSLFDGLFSTLDEDKESVLKNLKIISSSYRSQRANLSVKNKKNILVLLDFFGYNTVEYDKQEEYEILLTKIYYSCYYRKKDKLLVLLDELNKKINENNILLPLLYLFKIFIVSNLEYSLSEGRNIIEKELLYLSNFDNKHYFVEEFEFLYLLMMYYYDIDVKDGLKIDNLSIKYPKLLWLYYTVKAGKSYINKDDIATLVNYELALTEFRNNNNLERYFMTVNNASCLYNILKQYSSCLNLCSSIVEYIFFTDENSQKYRTILTNYLFANLMLQRFEEIVDFISILVFDFKYLNETSAIICLIATAKLGKEDLFNKICNLDLENKEFQIFIEYMKIKDKTLLDELTMTPYMKRIKKLVNSVFE